MRLPIGHHGPGGGPGPPDDGDPPSGAGEPTPDYDPARLHEPHGADDGAVPHERAAADHPRPRLHVVAGPKPPQRRENVRIPVVLPVQIETDAGEPVETLALNVSGGGMLVGVGPVAIDQEVAFRLDLGSGESPIEGRARVVRAAGNARRALAFEWITNYDRERLIKFVFERQRAALARRRSDAL